MEVEIRGRIFLKIFGSGSKLELKNHFCRVQIDGKRLCLQERGLDIDKNNDFGGQNAILLILLKILKNLDKIGLEEVVEEVPRADIL